MLEKDILLACQKRLLNWQSRGVVIWFDRNNSGGLSYGGKYIRLHKPGTPDLTAYIHHKGFCWVYFIETKIPGGKQSEHQLAFMLKFKNLDNIEYQIVTNPEQVDITIEKITGYTDKCLENINLE